MYTNKGTYEQACGLGQQSTWDYSCHRNRWVNTPAQLRPFFDQLLFGLFYEIVTTKSSELLSLFYRANNLRTTMENIEMTSKGSPIYFPDVLPIVTALVGLFRQDLKMYEDTYSKSKEHIFRRESFSLQPELLEKQYKLLDDSVGIFFAQRNSSSSGDSPSDTPKKTSKKAEEAEKAKAPDIVLRIHDPKITDELNQLAEKRRESDSTLLKKIQQLQVSLQDELKQIMEIREGIDYNITEEAIRQFVSLFYLLSETLQYHNPDPKEKDKEKYRDLVDSCEDFLGHIKQALSLLGVMIIDDKGKPFDPVKHKTARGIQPDRNGIIANVTKIGFSYKDKVLEKAEVELEK